ncbi:hypothetical protein FHX77_000128 [Bifidobacterium commune]|nr:hypothetical protein [Bifidobacterium commune]
MLTLDAGAISVLGVDYQVNEVQAKTNLVSSSG